MSNGQLGEKHLHATHFGHSFCLEIFFLQIWPSFVGRLAPLPKDCLQHLQAISVRRGEEGLAPSVKPVTVFMNVRNGGYRHTARHCFGGTTSTPASLFEVDT